MSEYIADLAQCTECEETFSVEGYGCECSAPVRIFSFTHTESRDTDPTTPLSAGPRLRLVDREV